MAVKCSQENDPFLDWIVAVNPGSNLCLQVHFQLILVHLHLILAQKKL